MGKATVESRLRLDAHCWADELVREAVPDLACCLAEAQATAGGAAEKTPQPSGLAGYGITEMRLARAGDTLPTGSLYWGVLAQQGGQAQKLLLLVQIKRGGHYYPRDQIVELSWTTPAGKLSRLPVLLCPFCGRRCRFLYCTYSARRGGPTQGEFACRTCANLCYAKQLEYRSEWEKNLDALLDYSEESYLHPEQVTERGLAKLEALAQSPFPLGPRLGRLMARSNSVTTIINTGKRDKPPVFTQPKRQGRPSPKQDRQQ